MHQSDEAPGVSGKHETGCIPKLLPSVDKGQGQPKPRPLPPFGSSNLDHRDLYDRHER